MWGPGCYTSSAICLQPAIHNMVQYVINIPNEKATSYKLVTFIIAIINIVAFVYLVLQGGDKMPGIAGAAISLACLLALVLKNKISFPKILSPESGFAAISMLWIATGNVLPGLLMLIFSLLGFYTNRKGAIRFTGEGIYYPSMPVKFFPWSQVDFAMLKDGILTIELKDNRVFQFTLSGSGNESLDEAGFNEFCSRQAQASPDTQ